LLFLLYHYSIFDISNFFLPSSPSPTITHHSPSYAHTPILHLHIHLQPAAQPLLERLYHHL
jgi:hypothetical protein